MLRELASILGTVLSGPVQHTVIVGNDRKNKLVHSLNLATVVSFEPHVPTYWY